MARAEARALMGDAPGARADLNESARLRDALGLSGNWDEMWVEPAVLAAAGDTRAAAEACRVALAMLSDSDALNRNFMLLTYARVLLDLGLDEEARLAVEPLESSAIVEHRATHRSLRARLLARAGDVDAALASIDEATGIAAPTGLAIIKADVALDRAYVLLAASRVEDAMASAEDALGRYRTKEHEVGARRAAALLGAIT
jgi:tetratricopeptide (TPR) repeat protein